ncbi:hypothetical protein EVAR_77170_1 [Eumeta japonica]|uniref:Uncharacterized protein n=1 Tax=Eumeta variegata TaxID=151549 RepID=A0A4C1T1U0_EUMVA|nr:hypothetical protein EVAR_77170_1 [Eumeta japonica]
MRGRATVKYHEEPDPTDPFSSFLESCCGRLSCSREMGRLDGCNTTLTEYGCEIKVSAVAFPLLNERLQPPSIKFLPYPSASFLHQISSSYPRGRQRTGASFGIARIYGRR